VPAACLGFFLLLWAVLAWKPLYRDTWFHENLLVFACVPLLVLAHRRSPFRRRSVLLLTLFFSLHVVGSHYSYSRVPIGDWAKEAFGWSRNHYDRLLHFLFGLLLAVPMRELLGKAGAVSPRGSFLLAWTSIVALSDVYELMEWGMARIVDPDAGIAFLGTQGDVWDAQKDMALAHSGALLALGLEYLFARRLESPG
jgi:putative membrane protein